MVIEIIFLNSQKDQPYTSVDSNVVKDKKSYYFNCTNESIKIGDVITDNRYTFRMQVVNTNNYNKQFSSQYKHIIINNLNDKDMIDISTTRVIKVSLEQAKDWYNSNNLVLRSLAASVYTREELILNFTTIHKSFGNKLAGYCYIIPKDNFRKIEVISKLHTIASYFNKGWVRKIGETGYFIRQNNDVSKSIRENISIESHSTVFTSGTAYFKNIEDAQKAKDLLTDIELTNLF